MVEARRICVSVPATTANLGPGFDCLGAALQLYNRFTFELGEAGTGFEVAVSGLEAERVNRDPRQNLACQVMSQLATKLGRSLPDLRLYIDLGVPLARGLGSSATAIIGGLLGANALLGSPLNQSELLNLAIEIEGHPDNVAPALLGGCCLSATDANEQWQICSVPWHASIVPVVAIPDFELSTREARAVLPGTVSRADAIFNTAHLGLLLRALETGNSDWLRAALMDRLHQPYRWPLITGVTAVQTELLKTAAYGLVISGAGPTLLALAPANQAEAVAQVMQAAWQSAGVKAQAKVLALDTQGASLT
ncbi:homoserine kinase [Leptolyngbya sp. FACHB-261]|nr:homoserine kinase [Leptolyngbya sp. FACHB-261]